MELRKYTVVGLTIDYNPTNADSEDADLHGRSYVEGVKADSVARAIAMAVGGDPDWRSEGLIVAVFEGWHRDISLEGSAA